MAFLQRELVSINWPEKKKSIIDVCLTSHISSVKSFNVLPLILGVNPQTCHKIIKVVISDIDVPEIQCELKSTQKLNFCSYETSVKEKGV